MNQEQRQGLHPSNPVAEMESLAVRVNYRIKHILQLNADGDDDETMLVQLEGTI